MKQKKKKRKKKRKHKEGITKDGKIRDITTLFEQEEDYYEREKVSNFWNNNYIEYGSNGDEKYKLMTRQIS